MKRNDILLLLIPSFLIVVFWVVFNIYHNFVTSTIPEDLNVQITPISPDFDTSVIENLKKRKMIEPLYIISPESQPGESTLPSPLTPTEVPISTASGQQATIGGELLP